MKPAPTLPLTTLALDCSFGGLALALQVGGKVHGRTVAEARASDKLLPLLHTLLADTKTEAAQLQHVILTVGPGSFTGIRLGLAVAQGLKLTNPGLTIIAVSTLSALAAQVAPLAKQPFTLLLDAAGGQVYRQNFTADATPLTPPACEPLATLKQLQPFVAAQATLLPPFPIQHTFTQCDAATLLALTTQPNLHIAVQPLYLKPLTYKRVG